MERNMGDVIDNIMEYVVKSTPDRYNLFMDRFALEAMTLHGLKPKDKPPAMTATLPVSENHFKEFTANPVTLGGLAILPHFFVFRDLKEKDDTWYIGMVFVDKTDKDITKSGIFKRVITEDGKKMIDPVDVFGNNIDDQALCIFMFACLRAIDEAYQNERWVPVNIIAAAQAWKYPTFHAMRTSLHDDLEYCYKYIAALRKAYRLPDEPFIDTPTLKVKVRYDVVDKKTYYYESGVLVNNRTKETLREEQKHMSHYSRMVRMAILRNYTAIYVESRLDAWLNNLI